MANLLIVDDEALLLDLVAPTLGPNGHTVRAIIDPLAELEICTLARDTFDMIITDVTMKLISDIELADRLRSAGIETPVLFISGYHTVAGMIPDTLGQWQAIDKSFTAAQLRAAVHRGLLRYAKLNGVA